MTNRGLSIGQVARRTGLSVHALRLYEREGLFASEVLRDGSGRRVYTEWDVEWLVNCVKFRASGMPLVTIARLARLVREGTGNEAERLELLREHRRHIIDQFTRLSECLDLINAKVASYERHLAAGSSGDPWQSPPPQPPGQPPSQPPSQPPGRAVTVRARPDHPGPDVAGPVGAGPDVAVPAATGPVLAVAVH